MTQPGARGRPASPASPVPGEPHDPNDRGDPAGAPHGPRPPSPASLRSRALRWLARREHSRTELARKLARVAPGEAEAAAIESLLDDLAARGLLSDRRAAESLLAGRGQRLGQLRLRHELRGKGLDAELCAEMLAGAAATELARARAIWQRRFGAPASDPRERARQGRFLAARGFTAEVVRRVIGGDDDAFG